MSMTSSTDTLRTIRDFIRYCTTRLYSSAATFNHGYAEPEEEAAFLVLRSLSIPLQYEEKFLDASLTVEEREEILQNISRRCDNLEPTAYITNEWWLTGYPFYVDERVLIPRSYIAELIEKNFDGILPPSMTIRSILDMCTGSGCLAVLLAKKYPDAEVDAVDISQDALEVAEINIEDYGLENRVYPIQSDLFENLQGASYDLIISNPPYVTEASMDSLPEEYRHEPALALAAGEDGMDIIERLLQQAPKHLNDNGVLIVELGDGAQAFKERFPNLRVTWLSTSGGSDQVFMIKKEQLPDA